jgi:hypothetical protein
MKRCSLVVLVAMLGLVVAAPAPASTTAIPPAKAQIAKKKKCKGKAWKRGKCQRKKKKKPVAPPAPPAPAALALTEAEVKNRVNQQAQAYCAVDIYCYAAGVYVDYTGGPITCSSKSTYSWSCYGWNEEYNGNYFTCDFRETVVRAGYNGITSQRDLSYGSNGWDCY